jgi:hypothetical protein
MSTPKGGSPKGADRYERMNEDLDRGLDESLAVQGSDEDALEPPEGEDALAALDESGGDAFPEDDDDEDVIPLPAETLNRGARRS